LRQTVEQQKVAAVPGIAFGADDYLRISYATSMANIEKAGAAGTLRQKLGRMKHAHPAAGC